MHDCFACPSASSCTAAGKMAQNFDIPQLGAALVHASLDSSETGSNGGTTLPFVDQTPKLDSSETEAGDPDGVQTDDKNGIELTPSEASSADHREKYSHTEDYSDYAEYDGEPFRTFQLKALALARSRIWPSSDPEDITVERIKGGDYNRLILLTKKPKDSEESPSKLVLRVPRFDDDAILDRVAALQFVSHKLDIPIANLHSYDAGTDNEIGRPYTVVELLDGANLETGDMYKKMSFQQKCKIAKELGAIYNQFLSVESPGAGVPTFPKDVTSLDGPISIRPLRMENLEFDEAKEKSIGTPRPEPVAALYEDAPRETVLELFSRMFQEVISLLWKSEPREPGYRRQYTELKELARYWDECGAFRDVHNCLVNKNLQCRKIMALAVEGSEAPLITGLPDWDNVFFGPAFLACEPPAWLWWWEDPNPEPGSDSDSSGDESEISQVSESSDGNFVWTPDEQHIKSIFDEAAGPIYVRFAYKRMYKMARRLFRFALEGVRNTRQNETISYLSYQSIELHNNPNFHFEQDTNAYNAYVLPGRRDSGFAETAEDSETADSETDEDSE